MAKTLNISSEQADGSPNAGAEVIIRLVDGGNTSADAPTRLNLDDNGLASVELFTNDGDDIPLSGTYYRVTVVLPTYTRQRHIQLLEATADPVEWDDPTIQVDPADTPEFTLPPAVAEPIVHSELGIFDSHTHQAAIEEGAELLSLPEELVEAIVDALESVELEHVTTRNGVIRNSSKLAVQSFIGSFLLGSNLYTVTQQLAEHLYVGPTQPAEPSDPTKAVWYRTKGNLKSFVDFGLFPDGPVHGKLSNGVGSLDPVEVHSFHTYHVDEGDPESDLLPFEPAQVFSGAVQSEMIERLLGPGIALDSISPSTGGMVAWGFDGYADMDDEQLIAYIPTNIAISDAVGNAYLLGIVLGKFVGDTDATDPDEPVSARMKLIRDDETEPHTVFSVSLPRVPTPSDYFWFYFDTANLFRGYMNGTQLFEQTETTHPVSSMDRIGMPIHQGASPNDWETCYFARVSWLGISGGDPITRDLGPHHWSEDKGWQPAGPQARPRLESGGGGTAGVTSITGALGTPEDGDVEIDSAFVGADPEGSAAGALATAFADLAAKTTTITAGDGLDGGGDLSGNRELSIEADILESVSHIGDSLVATTDSSVRTSNTVLADSFLAFTDMAPNTDYEFVAYLVFSGDSTADLRAGLIGPGDATVHARVEHSLTTGSSASDYDRASNLTSFSHAVGGILATATGVTIIGTISTGASGGTVSICWAPNTGGGTGAYRLAKSRIFRRPL